MTFAERVKQVRARARIRRWEFRQRNLAHGAWHRFRLALAEARAAYSISEAELEALIEEGFAMDDRGNGLVPGKRLVWISEKRARRLASAHVLEMRLDAAMLATTEIALVPFEEERVPALPGSETEKDRSR